MLTASNTILSSDEYAITRKGHFSFLAYTSCYDTATVTSESSPSSKNMAAAPTERARPGPSLPVFVILLSRRRPQDSGEREPLPI